MAARCATEAFSTTCAVHIEDCEGWWLSLEMVAEWPNMDMAVIMTSYGRRLFGSRPVKTGVRFIPACESQIIR